LVCFDAASIIFFTKQEEYTMLATSKLKKNGLTAHRMSRFFPTSSYLGEPSAQQSSRKLDFNADFSDREIIIPSESYIEIRLALSQSDGAGGWNRLGYKITNDAETVTLTRYAPHMFIENLTTYLNNRPIETQTSYAQVAVNRDFISQSSSAANTTHSSEYAEDSIVERAYSIIIAPSASTKNSIFLRLFPKTSFWQISEPTPTGGGIQLRADLKDKFYNYMLCTISSAIANPYNATTPLLYDVKMVIDEISLNISTYDIAPSIQRPLKLKRVGQASEYHFKELTAVSSLASQILISGKPTLVVIGFQNTEQLDASYPADPDPTLTATFQLDPEDVTSKSTTLSNYTVDNLSELSVKYANTILPTNSSYNFTNSEYDYARAYQDFIHSIQRDNENRQAPCDLVRWMLKYPLFAFQLPTNSTVNSFLEVRAKWSVAFTGQLVMWTYQPIEFDWEYDSRGNLLTSSVTLYDSTTARSRREGSKQFNRIEEETRTAIAKL